MASTDDQVTKVPSTLYGVPHLCLEKVFVTGQLVNFLIYAECASCIFLTGSIQHSNVESAELRNNLAILMLHTNC